MLPIPTIPEHLMLLVAEPEGLASMTSHDVYAVSRLDPEEFDLAAGYDLNNMSNRQRMLACAAMSNQLNEVIQRTGEIIMIQGEIGGDIEALQERVLMARTAKENLRIYGREIFISMREQAEESIDLN